MRGPLHGPWRIWFIILFFVLVGPTILRVTGLTSQAEEISYSRFRELVGAGRVAEVTLEGRRIEGVLKGAARESTDDATEFTHFETHAPSFGTESLLQELEQHNVEIQARSSRGSPWWPIVIGILPLLVLLALGWSFAQRMRAQQGGLFSIGKSRARLYDREKADTGFDDVAGADQAKQELAEIVSFLQEPRKFQRLGAEPPRGVLLVGPPGTGKTLLARATAGEAEVPFFSITGSDFMEMFVGVGASRVRGLFEDARKAAPSIVFIDELDSIGRRRGAGLGGGHDEREQTLNQLLSEMDGFLPNENVIVMAATNRPDILDPALLRPGRFDRHVTVDLPATRARKGILELHARDKQLDKDVDLERIAQSTPGFSGADLKNLLNEAALLAGRKGRQRIRAEDVEQARDKALLGAEREGLVLTEDECRQLAYHEGGHAVVAAVLPHADPLHKVTIIPRGRSMGVTQQIPQKDRYVYSREYLLDRLAVMMGGRAAEQIVFQTETSGAEDDLKQAQQLARKMVLDWGMGKDLGHQAFSGRREHVFLGEEISQRHEYSESTARDIDREVRSILEEAYARACDTLEKRRSTLDAIAEHLQEHEEMMGEEVQEYIEERETEKV